jgi:hypothetical protein
LQAAVLVGDQDKYGQPVVEVVAVDISQVVFRLRLVLLILSPLVEVELGQLGLVPQETDLHLVFLLLVPQVEVLVEYSLSAAAVDLVDQAVVDQGLVVGNFLVAVESLDKVMLAEPLLLPARTATYPAEAVVVLAVSVVLVRLLKVVMVV